jgi:5-(carboxyamino)imidazole ribonucleotide mutase
VVRILWESLSKFEQKSSKMKPMVGVIMGSYSDFSVMRAACDYLEEFEIPFEVTVVSAHRTPDRMVNYASDAASRGLKVIIAGAGGAAHLPGMVASLTTLPVIGVPIKSSNSIDGWDSILSILQMPSGIPVATVALNGAGNAGILAASILGAFDADLAGKMKKFKERLAFKVKDSLANFDSLDYRFLVKS